MDVIRAPSRKKAKHPTLFLAGSIDCSHTWNWQDDVTQKLAGFNITLFNPRWTKLRDEPAIRHEQVSAQMQRLINWDLAHLEKADFIVMWLEDEGPSPISLLELGLYAHSRKILVGCPPGYARAANVYVTCRRYGIKLYHSYDSFVRAARAKAKELTK